MRLREGGMPEEQYWESLFNIELTLDRLGIDATLHDVAKLGCGYGTFALPVARRISGVIETFDTEPVLDLPPWHYGLRLARTARHNRYGFTARS
jgi:hypothetical protein